MKKNKVKITRVPGDGRRCTATLKLEFDFADQEAISRFARLLRELIPEEERAQFLEDWRAAAMNAGFPAFAK